MNKSAIFICSLLMLCAILTGCGHAPSPDISPSSMATITPKETAPEIITPAPEETTEPTPTAPLVPEREVELVAKTLRGECYDDQPADKREVVRVICNRVSAGRFGASIEAVITAPDQFVGYSPDNIPTANDYTIARDVLTEWCASGCQPFDPFLYFTAGDGHTNVFRENY